MGLWTSPASRRLVTALGRSQQDPLEFFSSLLGTSMVQAEMTSDPLPAREAARRARPPWTTSAIGEGQAAFARALRFLVGAAFGEGQAVLGSGHAWTISQRGKSSENTARIVHLGQILSNGWGEAHRSRGSSESPAGSPFLPTKTR
jgi:hypothetical protein